MNRAGERTERLAGGHQHGNFTDQLARMTAHDRGADDLACSLACMNDRKAVLLAVDDRAVDFGEVGSEAVYGDSGCFGVGGLHADLGQLRIGVRHTGND